MNDLFSLKDKHALVIAPSSIILFIGLVLGIWFLFLIKNILILLFLSFIIMTALHSGVNRLVKFKLPRSLSVIIVYLSSILLIVGLLALILPPLGVQMYQLAKTIELPFFNEEFRSLRLTLSELGTLAQQVGSSAGLVFSIISQTFSGMFTFVTLIIMSYYLMVDRPLLHKKVLWFSKNPKHVDFTKKLLDSIEIQLGGWIRGQLLLMLIIGVISYIGLTLLNVPYALPLAFLAGMLEIVPNLGPTIAAIPAILLAFASGGPVLGGLVTLFAVVVQQLENGIIVPKIMQQNADVNPLVSIVAILVGLQLGGVVGALLGVPAYIVFRATYSLWYRQ